MIKKYFIAARSIISMLTIKILYPLRVKIEGFPVSLAVHNIQIAQNGNIQIGKRINILTSSRLIITGNGKIRIGKGVYFNSNVICCCRNKVEIGDGCRFGPNICIYDHDHLYSYEGGVLDEYKLGEIVIGKGCWFGANSVILRNTHIGDGCVIGAGVVVKGDIPPHSIVTLKGIRQMQPRL